MRHIDIDIDIAILPTYAPETRIFTHMPKFTQIPLHWITQVRDPKPPHIFYTIYPLLKRQKLKQNSRQTRVKHGFTRVHPAKPFSRKPGEQPGIILGDVGLGFLEVACAIEFTDEEFSLKARPVFILVLAFW